MEYYVFLDDNNYVVEFVPTYATIVTPPSDKYETMELNEDDIDKDDTDCYYIEAGKLKFDKQKKQSKVEPPTWMENMESQIFYTAMMTDTLIEE